MVEWRLPPPGAPLPGARSVDLWLTSFADLEHFRGDLLDSSEQATAQRRRSGGPREKFIQARSWLRQALARYLPIAASEIEFRYGDRGKPWLPPVEGRQVSFNLSHTEGLALLAVASGMEVGVDVEAIRPDRDHDGLARRYFSAAEVEEYDALPEHLRVQAFFSGWTRKEAFIKAKGDGLYFPLDGFSVRLSPLLPAELLDVRDDPAERNRWRLHEVDVGPDHAAALVVEGDVETVNYYRGP